MLFSLSIQTTTHAACDVRAFAKANVWTPADEDSDDDEIEESSCMAYIMKAMGVDGYEDLSGGEGEAEEDEEDNEELDSNVGMTNASISRSNNTDNDDHPEEEDTAPASEPRLRRAGRREPATSEYSEDEPK